MVKEVVTISRRILVVKGYKEALTIEFTEYILVLLEAWGQLLSDLSASEIYKTSEAKKQKKERDEIWKAGAGSIYSTTYRPETSMKGTTKQPYEFRISTLLLFLCLFFLILLILVEPHDLAKAQIVLGLVTPQGEAAKEV